MIDNRVRSCVVERVYDGDTLFVTVDHLLLKQAEVSCRLAGINCRELGDTGGKEARDFVSMWAKPGAVAQIVMVRRDKYWGRFDGIVYFGDMNLNDRLVQDGWAAPWDGTGAAPKPMWPRLATPTLSASEVWKPND